MLLIVATAMTSASQPPPCFFIGSTSYSKSFGTRMLVALLRMSGSPRGFAYPKITFPDGLCEDPKLLALRRPEHQLAERRIFFIILTLDLVPSSFFHRARLQAGAALQGCGFRRSVIAHLDTFQQRGERAPRTPLLYPLTAHAGFTDMVVSPSLIRTKLCTCSRSW